MLNVTQNPDGFAYRFKQGKDYAALNIVSELKNMTTTAKQITYNLDIVAHSMGFAYAQGFIAGLKESELKDKIKWKGYYILAPENGCGGSVNPADWADQVWQYGANLGELTQDPLWLQDGVAPQCAVVGLEQASAKSGRAFIPDKYTTPRKVIRTEILRYEYIAGGYPYPVYGSVEETVTDAVPKGFIESHSISNYGWIFEIKPEEPTGYVKPKLVPTHQVCKRKKLF